MYRLTFETTQNDGEIIYKVFFWKPQHCHPGARSVKQNFSRSPKVITCTYSSSYSQNFHSKDRRICLSK